MTWIQQHAPWLDPRHWFGGSPSDPTLTHGMTPHTPSPVDIQNSDKGWEDLFNKRK